MANITITHPEIAKQWHPTKNGDLKAEKFTYGSDKNVWWRCPIKCKEGCLHEWEAPIYRRTGASPSCPFCCIPHQKMCIHESITYTHPEIANQWHPTKNGVLTPRQFSQGSNKPVWWTCEKTNCKEKCRHDYEMRIASKISGSGCPYCSKPAKKVCIHNSFAHLQPEITKQWHPTKNGKLKPEEVSECSGKKVWWLCPNTCNEGCKHEWKCSISHRKNGTNCPFCIKQQICIHDSIVYSHPELIKQWHPTKNGKLKPEQFSSGSGHQEIWWNCENTCSYGCKHEWTAYIYSRTSGSGCPHCDGKCRPCIHNSIVYSHPEIAKQWHPTKNCNMKPEHYTKGANVYVWWFNNKCNHAWNTKINNRTHGKGCPYCVNKTEQKLYHALILHYPQLIHQFKVDWCMNINHLPYDFVLKEDKIIIELDGFHHFEDVPHHKSTYREKHGRDIYKMKCAKANSYSVIRLLQTDVFYDTYDWLTDLRANIEKIKAEQRVQRVYMCKDNEYAVFNKSVRKYKLIWKERCVLCDINHPVEQSSQCN
jgi:very-short-patch-repair endonuclease